MLILMALVGIPSTILHQDVSFFLLLVNLKIYMRLVLLIVRRGNFSFLLYFLQIVFFRGRKGAECFSISLCCQLPHPYTRADDGIIPIDLRNITSFGIWLTEQVVLYWHQKKSKLPIYAEASHTEPLMAFTFLVNLAVATRPFLHPGYYQGLR